MEIGKVIRQHRKLKHLTQEQMANYLGVSAPAVNKWEKQHSLPDITLLAPIARLLDISLETLLSFHKTLTTEEINQKVLALDRQLKTESFSKVLTTAKETIDTYPNCYPLIWQYAVILDSWCLAHDSLLEDQEAALIESWYLRVLDSGDDNLKIEGASALYGFYIRKEAYLEAEKCLDYFSKENPLRQEKQAFIYSKTNQLSKAYQLYEETLLSSYQTMSLILNDLYLLAQQAADRQQAYFLVEKQRQLAQVLEMGAYHQWAPMLDYGIAQEDRQLTLDTMEKLLKSVDTVTDFTRSPLYQHLEFHNLTKEYRQQQQKTLKAFFKDEVTFAYLKEDERWQKLVQGF